MARLGSNASVTLNHMHRRFYAPGYAYVRYSPYALELSRPQSGKTHENVTCPRCRATVTCTIRDIRGTIRIRWLYGTITLGAILGMVAIFQFGIPWAVEQDTAIPALSLVAVFVTLFIILFRAGILSLVYPGVNVKGIPMLPRRHEIGG
jgi:hypothetical protein